MHYILEKMVQSILNDEFSLENLIMPGNPRYQPKELTTFFGYDNLFKWLAVVEVANLLALPNCPKPTEEQALKLLEISTTLVDEREGITRHDIRAWVQLAQEKCPELAKWIHIPLTSYDALDTARTLQFKLSYKNVLKPKIKEFISLFADIAEKHKELPQIGRTHGQCAIPITVGFWLASILERIVYNFKQMDYYAEHILGKISGAVGAYNAQRLLKIDNHEIIALGYLDLRPAPISTQILPPEPLAYYLFTCTMMSTAIAQFANDCRHLTRSEIMEISEPFDEKQVGSSTMAHKRNPIVFENTVGLATKNKVDFLLVLETLISEHQRDLTASSIYRDFPMIILNLVCQLNNMTKRNKQDIPFLNSIFFNEAQIKKNLLAVGDIIMAEPLYILLQANGYDGDAHDLVNHTLVERAKKNGSSLYQELLIELQTNNEIASAFNRIPRDIQNILQHPELYIGRAVEKTMEIVENARNSILA